MDPTSMPMIQLSSGHSMPQIGLGTWKSSPVAVRGSVLEAIRCGYRHIDCAAKYENEHEVGQALEEALQAGEVERSALFVASKLWNDMHASADVERACRQSLADLRLDYLDLYLIHWPVADGSPPPSTEETWRAMEGLVDAGLVRSIGVSNFSAPKLRDVCELARIAPVVNQVELHPLWRQDALLAAASELGVHMTAYSPLGSADSADIFNHQGARLLEHPDVVAIAERLGRTPAQVLLRWAIERGTCAIAKSVHPERLRENLDVLSWALGDEQHATLSHLEPQKRLIHGALFLAEQGQYQTLAQLWDDDEETPDAQAAPTPKAPREDAGEDGVSVGA